jgi:hypothetical protein
MLQSLKPKGIDTMLGVKDDRWECRRFSCVTSVAMGICQHWLESDWEHLWLKVEDDNAAVLTQNPYSQSCPRLLATAQMRWEGARQIARISSIIVDGIEKACS